MNRNNAVSFLIVVLLLSSSAGILLAMEQDPSEKYNEPAKINNPEILPGPKNMDGWFIKNRGQVHDPQVRFVYVSPAGDSVVFVPGGYRVVLTGEDELTSVVEVNFERARTAMPRGRTELPHKSSYLLGNDPENWHTDIVNYRELVYQDLYPGIDLVFRATESKLKYDFLVSRGADPGMIGWSYQGVDQVFLSPSGDIHLKTQAGELVEEAPFSYQMNEEKMVEVPSYYQLKDKNVSFGIGNYDPELPLVIDPLIYSTYVGGTGGDLPYGMALDSKDNIYITGYTDSVDLPTTAGSFCEARNEGKDVFVFKLSPGGTELLYSTFIGGSGDEGGSSLAVDDDGSVFITGNTNSSDFPTTAGCFNRSFAGGKWDAFVLKLNAEGTELLYSSFVGGSKADHGSDIALDGQGNACVTGTSESEDFPSTAGSFDELHNGNRDVVVFKMNHNGSQLLFSSFLGGGWMEGGMAIALDKENNVYVTGITGSSEFPVTEGCYDDSYGGGDDAFVSKLDPNGSRLVYSSFVGGDDYDHGQDIALDDHGNAYITGTGQSPDFPVTPGAYSDSHKGIVVFKINSDGSDLVYSSYVGDKDWGSGSSIALDPENNACIIGDTSAENFPTTPGCLDRSYNGDTDVYFFKLDSKGSDLLYSTYLGSDLRDEGSCVAVDSQGAIYLAGWSRSTEFPTTQGSFDQSHNGDIDVFVCQLELPTVCIDSIVPAFALDHEAVSFSGRELKGEIVQRYVWSSSLDGEFYNGTEANFSSSDLSVGSHIITLRVLYASGNWSKETTATLHIEAFRVLSSDYQADENPSPIINTVGNFNKQENPSISGSVVAWTDNRYQKGDVFMFDLNNPGEVRLIANFEGDLDTSKPMVDGDIIVWSPGASDAENTSFYSYDIENPEFGGKYLFSTEGLIYETQFSYPWVAWTVYAKDGPGWNNWYAVYCFNMETGKTKKIGYSASGIGLSGDRLLYAYESKSHNDEKCSFVIYNLTNELEVLNLTIYADGGDIWNLDLYDDLIVWEDSREDKNEVVVSGVGDTNIYLIDLGTQQWGPITSHISSQMQPLVHGDHVVWVDKRGELPALYAYSISRDEMALISENPNKDEEFSISGDILVWRGDDDMVYIYDLKEANWGPGEASFMKLADRETGGNGGNDGNDDNDDDDDDSGFLPGPGIILLLISVGVALFIKKVEKEKRRP